MKKLLLKYWWNWQLDSYDYHHKDQKKSKTEGESRKEQEGEESIKSESPIKRLMSVEEMNLENVASLEEDEVYNVGFTVLLRYFKACGVYFVTGWPRRIW